MSSALFGNAARASSKNLVEFRAGKMHLKGKMVHPDKRKGLLYLYQSEDSLMHFCWKDRTSGSVEEDLIIFPDDCTYKRIAACTSGRAYVLKFRSTTRRLFFWMQEPKTEKDDDYCRKINDFLNHPPSPGVHSSNPRSGIGGSSSGGTSTGSSSSAGSGNAVLGGHDLSSLRDSDLQNLLGNISQQQLMQILGSGVPNLSSLLTSSGRSGGNTSVTPTTASTPTTGGTPPPTSSSSTSVSAMDTNTTVSSSGAGTATSASGAGSTGASKTGSSDSPDPIRLADLQNILTNIMNKDGTSGGSSASGGVAVDLSPAMTAEALQPILSNPSFVDKLKPYLPESSDKLPTEEHLKGTISSPQFKQAVSIFSQALQSGQLGPLINQFGLGEDAVLAAAAGDMEAFVKALSKKDKKDDPKDKKDEDESMAVD